MPVYAGQALSRSVWVSSTAVQSVLSIYTPTSHGGRSGVLWALWWQSAGRNRRCTHLCRSAGHWLLTHRLCFSAAMIYTYDSFGAGFLVRCRMLAGLCARNVLTVTIHQPPRRLLTAGAPPAMCMACATVASGQQQPRHACVYAKSSSRATSCCAVAGTRPAWHVDHCVMW